MKLKLSSFIYKNVVRSLKHYSLYIFALIFSVAIIYSFHMMSHDAEVNKVVASSISMRTSFNAGSIFLMIVMMMFILFANQIFIKRQADTYALYQLIGMNRFQVLRVMMIENIILYSIGFISGLVLGTLLSRFFLLILVRLMSLDLSVKLTFNMQSLIETLLLFVVIFIVLILQNYLFLKRYPLIDLLNINQKTEFKVRSTNTVNIILGLCGILLIALGYYLSTKIFSAKSEILMLANMIVILVSTVGGSYLFFKYSVELILNIYRKKKEGHLSVTETLSVMSVLFRMRKNAFLLTAVTTLTAISITALSFAYMTYYSAERTVEDEHPFDYAFAEKEDYEHYKHMLDDKNIDYVSHIYDVNDVDAELNTKSNDMFAFFIVDADRLNKEVDKGTVLYYGYNSILNEFMKSDDDTIRLIKNEYQKDFEIKARNSEQIFDSMVVGGLPTLVLNHDDFEEIISHYNEADKERFDGYQTYGIDIKNGDSEEIQKSMTKDDARYVISKLEIDTMMKQSSGLLLFIMGFLGFMFLFTSGCVLYFRQVGEADEEKPEFNILRKIGFTNKEMYKGIIVKMIITFGIPLVLGLFHTYFAVKSAWFLFGQYLYVPLLIVIGVYTVLYSIFAVFSLNAYKKVMRM